MSLRSRVAVTSAAAVAVALLLASLAVYATTARRLTVQVDHQLDATARTVLALSDDATARDRLELFERFRDRSRQRRGPAPPAPSDDRFLGPFPDGVLQAVSAGGQVRTLGQQVLPVDDTTLALVRGERDGPVRSTVAVGGAQVRVLGVAAGDDGALQLGLPLGDRDRALAALARQLLLAGLLGAALAGPLGVLVAVVAVRSVADHS
jgi:hypothetical protein